ncbi:MAG: hypothetical protein CMJ64_14080 [Planctomycetaceae bacterium]|nr:hypothetical protein [Planctomycetaceae bacterium]
MDMRSSSIIGLLNLLLVLQVSRVVGVEVDPADAKIVYSGRWDLREPHEPSCAWQGSSFKVAFRGRWVCATIDCDRNEYVRIVVDGNSAGSRRSKLKKGSQTLYLAQDLPAGGHQIEVVKETYSGPGYLTLRSIEVPGELLRCEPIIRLRVQYYGDSNLAGHSLGHEKNKGGAEFAGCHFTFAGIASRMLDADYQNISCGGAGILGRSNSVMNFYDRIDFYQAQPKWEFTRFPADICVVNIGANDIKRRTKTELKQDFKQLLRVLRKVHPDAHFVLMNGYGWDRREPANYTHEVVSEIGEGNMSCLTFPWLFNEWHGCEYDHAGMARTLVEHLGKIKPSWKQVRSMDVMDGFGRNGDFANGGFEHVAPFGGFGWRYSEDGATRVYAPGDSAKGQWYLHLPEGKQVHQPNPARKDRSYRVNMKLRSPHTTGKARIRVEFRDQQWRNEIANSAREFEFPLTDRWQEYSLGVNSPSGTKDPSRDPWQIIIRLFADKGDIHCDDVRLTGLEVSK